MSKTYLPSKHLNFYNKKTYQLSNPVLGANGDKDCIAPAIANKIKSKKSVIFLTNGWGGTSIYDWSHPKSMLTKYVRSNLKHLLNRHSLKYVIWIQGESDNNTDVDYVKEFNLFRTNLFKGIEKKKYNNSKFIITQTSICGTDRDRVLNTQQKKLAEKNKTLVTNSTDNLDINYRFDNCHFNKFGTEKIATEISKLIFDDIKTEISPSMIQLPQEIKSLGKFNVKVNLHSQVQAELKLQVISQENIK